MSKLGKLEQVPLREIWPHEAHDFTNWLAEDENLDALSEELSVNLSLISTEHPVGAFNVDIYCEIEETGKKVIIENQLERTDHDHLGKIITYASGLDAEYVIWIVSAIREEHQSAVEWLNRVTTDEVSFFLIKMEAWSIDGSIAAPKFNIIEEPNNWSKNIKTQNTNSIKGKRFDTRQQFWNIMNDAIENDPKKRFKTVDNLTNSWIDLRFGKAAGYAVVDLLQQSSQLRVSFYMYNNTKYQIFEKVFPDKSDIEEQIDFDLTWENDLGKSHAKIYTMIDIDIDDKKDWKGKSELAVSYANIYKDVFFKYLK